MNNYEAIERIDGLRVLEGGELEEALRMATNALRYEAEYARALAQLRIERDMMTVCGYPAAGLALVAELLRKQLIEEESLKALFTNFGLMYDVITKMQKTEIERTMEGIRLRMLFPQVSEVMTEFTRRKLEDKIYDE